MEEEMDDLPNGVNESEEDILSCRVCDEAIETAAASARDGMGSLTISFCSGLDTCPA
jgi:hypothetical protein